ncbi:S-layer homology domain-containing protein [Paenibacillus sacheonensis]|uniref:SLH domain-containing protein n=1 Tax=Paenibacillus sacheonensis TaxID=742054 RepID=A0A7X4YPQ0_9BACL|nr:S-layer homology domain-containing protein [Paenibacillus sacheonensis]MBM7565022.1 hypothetical protein [Paenibacillus sacheonensis]NBC70193.1 hypothetical protein [Paenibacillus sacheonensis]
MVRKAFTLLLLSMLLIIGLPSLAFAGALPSVVLSIDKKDAAVGSEVKVTITGSSLADVYAYEASVRFDAKRLKLKNAVSLVDGFSVQPIVKNDSVTFAHTKIGDRSGDSGTVALATLTFTALANGAAEISLMESKLVNARLESKTYPGASKVKTVIANGHALRDITGHWAESAIKRAVALGIVQGYADDRFLPDQPVTRAEFAVMLVRALNPSPEVSKSAVFKDAASLPAWGKSEVFVAALEGWITGYDDGTFRAGKPITRAELSAMSVRGLRWQPDNAAKLAFADTKTIAPWARPYVSLAAGRKLMGGRSSNLFAPNEATTRAEASAIVVKMYDAKMAEGG